MDITKFIYYMTVVISSILSRFTKPLQKIMTSMKPSQDQITSLVSRSAFYDINLYLIRHGETEANRDNILQGHCDYPLTDKGKNEGKGVGIALNKMHWQKVYCSDLKRAHDTCILLISNSQTNSDISRIEVTQLLREISFGVREALPKETTTEQARIIVAKKLGIPVAEVIDTAEQANEVRARQQKFIDKIIELPLNDEQNNILVVSHGGYIRAFLRDFCSIQDIEKIKNCSISRIRLKINKSDKNFTIECERNDLNTVKHLNEIQLV
jgi:broad specificity phosphatase PhoE